MEVDILLFVTILFVATPIFAQENICSYMIAIPREPKPDDFPTVIEEGTWNDRPLFPGPERQELCMSSYIPGSGAQTIYMEEEIDGDVIIAKINYNGDVEPHINRDFLSGSSALLGVVTKRIDGSWYLVVTQKQDYEAPGMQLYVFYLSVDGQSLALITSVIIVNIDDNRPMIQVFDACTIAELGEARLSECVYDVSDADGRISTSAMTFEIESDRNDDEIFYIEGTNWPNDWFHMSMTVGIRTPLNFDENALHIFQVTALDSLPNTHTVTMMVQVENVEHRPPRWVEIFAVQQFDEKTAVNFRVRAIDGDTGINRPIYYRIETEEEDVGIFYIETNPGGREGATLFVNPIDRDTLEREVFQLSIIAYKLDDEGQESYSTEAPVVIIVNDINDQEPEPFHDEYHIDIEEETAMTLNLQEFGFHDRDLGQNAQYEVFLESISPPGAHEAFYIAPLVGYQRQTFIIGTTNHNMLDYEEPDFQNIVLKVRAVDMNNTDFVGEARLFINLINWNDELPIFDEEITTVTFNETEGTGFLVGNVRASDRDIDDRVVHSLMGNVATDFLRIDEDTGDIFVTADDAFDYHRQNVIFVQVRADDTLGEPLLVNTAVTQLVIQLLDINNTPPTLRLPRGTFSTDENVPEGHLITHEIVATDPDTTALLEFEINWDGSYATKQGRATDENEYRGCVEIITEYPDENSKGDARGRIKVKEIRPNITIDFEMFEVLYLSIRVYDRMTYIGDEYDESMFTITIVDLNDNPPVWEDGTLEQQFSVREMSASGTVIGSVLATDIDGPQYNQVRYTIFPREDTPPDLVTIHFYTGQITVNADNAIDADVPKRWHLYYTVIASDKCYVDPEDCPPDPHYHDTDGEITINIIDTNNKLPQPDYDDERFKLTVELLENATNLEFVSYVVGKDLDRDELYHQVGYLMNYAMNPRLLQFFAVEQDTGSIYVNYPEGSTEVLDRDGTEPTHELYFNLYDNFHRDGDGFRNQYDDEVRITVVLLDVNDNAPELPDPSTISWTVSENHATGTSFLPILHAPDIDEPNTPNSLVGFVVEYLIPHRDIEEKKLIDIRSIDTDKGEFFTIADLRGYWGTYDMHIWAYDHGDDPQQHSREVYELVIRPWNYHEPVFVFPLQDTVIRLSREQALVSNFLQTTDGNFLQQIHATDEDGGEAGQVTFQVVGDDEAVEFFDISNGPDNYGTLNLRRNDFADILIKEFQVTIEATDGGTEPEPLSSRSTFRAVFVPTTGEPIFDINTATVAFIELEEGLTERHELPLAKDLKNHLCVDNCYDIFYKITGGNSEGYFDLDPRNNIIYLTRELDRSVSEAHTLTVAASNSMESTNALVGSTLTVTVNVREANPRPIFLREIYTAGISTLDVINRELLTVQATHTEDLPITYAIDMSSMTADSSLQAVQEQAFTLDPQTGVLTLNIQPSSSMHGMFDFNVVATDSDGGSDTTKVRVYLISTQNRVTFRFVNALEKVEDSKDFIAQTFSAGFGMTCNVDQVLPAADAQGLAVGNLTELRAHFIRDDAPVPADEIEQLRSDTVLLREIQTTLNTELLVLDDFFTDISPEVGTDSTQITIYVLAGLAALLGFMFVVLLVAYIIRTRILSRRLEALSITKYGSVDSGLNRAGLAAPGTNKHAAEGSNPIWNESFKAPDFDAISEVSYDSDLIGIEDLPQFRNDYFPRESGSMRGILSNEEPVATHSNNFGFSTPASAPEFARKQFRND